MSETTQEPRIARIESQIDSNQAWAMNVNSTMSRIEQKLDNSLNLQEASEERLTSLEKEVRNWKRLGGVLGVIATALTGTLSWILGR